MKTTLLFLAVTLTTLRAEDIKTLSGQEYNACWVRAHFMPDQAGPLTQFRPGKRLTFIATIAGLRSYALTITNCYLPR